MSKQFLCSFCDYECHEAERDKEMCPGCKARNLSQRDKISKAAKDNCLEYKRLRETMFHLSENVRSRIHPTFEQLLEQAIEDLRCPECLGSGECAYCTGTGLDGDVWCPICDGSGRCRDC